MEKVIFVAWAPEDRAPLEAERVVIFNEKLLQTLDASHFPDVALQVEDYESTSRWQRGRRPAGERVIASLALWTECSDDVDDVEFALSELSPRYAGYLVTEAVPRWQTDRGTSSREPQPGVTLTSLLYRSPAMTHETFVEHWREIHQPMSLRIHPQVTYVRNVVASPLTKNAPAFDAISEEGCATVEDIIDPTRFYSADGNPWEPNAATIGDDVRVFLDRTRTTATIMREYRLRNFRRAG